MADILAFHRCFIFISLKTLQISQSCRKQPHPSHIGLSLVQKKKKNKKFLRTFAMDPSVEWPCGYQSDNLAVGTVRPSYESLQEKLRVSVSGYESPSSITMLFWTYLKSHTRFRIPIVNMKVTLRWVECTHMDDNIWEIEGCHPSDKRKKDRWKIDSSCKSRHSYAQQCPKSEPWQTKSHQQAFFLPHPPPKKAVTK